MPASFASPSCILPFNVQTAGFVRVMHSCILVVSAPQSPHGDWQRVFGLQAAKNWECLFKSAQTELKQQQKMIDSLVNCLQKADAERCPQHTYSHGIPPWALYEG